jgi:hypothetical protein
MRQRAEGLNDPLCLHWRLARSKWPGMSRLNREARVTDCKQQVVRPLLPMQSRAWRGLIARRWAPFGGLVGLVQVCHLVGFVVALELTRRKLGGSDPTNRRSAAAPNRRQWLLLSLG